MANQLLKVGHRGAAALEPQNTMRSYVRAADLGVDMVEIDVHRTRDGQLALVHDREARDVSTERALTVATSTLAELRTLDVGKGERVPTLPEVIEALRGRAALMLDMKAFGFEEEVVACLREGGVKDAIISGCPAESRARFRALAPEYPISTTLSRPGGPDYLLQLDTSYVTPEYRFVDAQFVATVHDRGIKAVAWTVNQLEAMENLIAFGIDGIITDRPDLFAELKTAH